MLTISPGTPCKAWLNFPKREGFSWTVARIIWQCVVQNPTAWALGTCGLDSRNKVPDTNMSPFMILFIRFPCKHPIDPSLKWAKLHSHRSDSWTSDVCTHTHRAVDVMEALVSHLLLLKRIHQWEGDGDPKQAGRETSSITAVRPETEACHNFSNQARRFVQQSK